MDKETAIKSLYGLVEECATQLKIDYLYKRKLKEAVRLRNYIQKENSDLINELMDCERLLQFVPKNLERTFLSTLRAYFVIRHHERISSSMLKDYDEKSKLYDSIKEKMGEIVSIVEEYDKIDSSVTILPTLKELISNYRLSLDSIDNYRNNMKNFWSIFYPHKPFQRCEV